MASWLAVASIAWPLLLGAAWASHGDGHLASAARAMYLGAALVCHQRPDRSFVTADRQWPVCARCSGLYAAAPLGALIALARRSRGRRPAELLAIASAPTLITIAIEWLSPIPMSNLARALAALPCGAALAFLIVSAARPAPRSIGLH